MKRKTVLAMMLCGAFAAAVSCAAIAEEAVEETEAVSAEVVEETEGVVYEVEELGDKPEYTATDYVTVGEYKGLAVEVSPYTVDDAAVASAVSEAIDSAVEEKELFIKGEGTVAEGDTANIDFVGKIDGEAFEGGTGENYDLEIGSGSFIDGFEEQLVGVNTGDTVDVNVTFPEDYWSEDLAGKPAVFTVTVNYIKTTPELTDALVSEVTDGEYTTLEAYNAYQKEILEEEAAENEQSDIESELMTQLYNTCEVTGYPEELVEYSVKSARNYYIQMANAYGMDYPTLLSYFGMESDEAFVEVLREDVKESLMQELILEAVAATEGLTVTDEEYTEGANGYVASLGYDSVEALEADYSHDEIAQAILMTKTIEMVKENAVVTYAEPSTEDIDLDELFEEIELETGDFEIVYEDESEMGELIVEEETE